MTLLDGEQQYVKGASVDLGPPVPAAQSFCQYVVRDEAPFTVADVRDDARVSDSSALVDAGLITYCGVPLVDSDGETLGSLCAMDGVPRNWSAEDVELLRELAQSAMTEVNLRLANRRLEAREQEAAALHARQARLAGIVEAAEEAINLVDLDGRVMGWNAACERLYGWTAEEVMGRPLTEVGFLVADTDDQRGFALDARALAGESVSAKRLRRRRRDGGLVYVDISLTPLRDPDGGIVGVTAVARDVTDRHRLSLELEASERRFRHTFDRAPTGVTLVGLDRRLLDANDAFCEIVGYGREELIGQTLEHITHPDDQDNDICGAREMVAGRTQHYTTEKRYRHKHGRISWVRLSATLVRGEEGDPRYFIVHTEDITASRIAQLELEDARALLDESQAVAHVGSWSYDLETGTVAWSREQYRLHGVAPDRPAPSIAGIVELVVAEDREAIGAALEALVADPRSFSGEYRVQLADGSVRTLWTSAAALDADPARGRRARISGTTRDVTAEREAERGRREVEQRHSRLLSSLPDTMVILYDTELRCQLMQGGLLGEIGIDPAAHVGQRLVDQLTTEQSKVLPGLVRRALAGESITIDHDSGRGRHFQIEFAPFQGEDGEVAGAFTVWRDITARLAGEEERRTLAAMLTQSEDAIIAKDAHGTIIEWNGGAERLYGHTRAEAVGRSIAIIIPPEREGEDRVLLARALQGESIQRDTIRMRRDGSRVDVSISVSPLTDAGGTIDGALVIARDISLRIREQAARREIEERLRVTVEHAPIGVALVDVQDGPHGRLLSVNGAFAALLGDPDPVAADVSLLSAVHPDDAAALRADLALLASGDGARTESEIRCLHADGRVVWLLVTGAAVPSQTGGPQLAVMHALDIGERKRFEGQLQHLADHDALTGLFNRRRFESELARTVSLAERYGYESALLMIDLDGFKHVNDTMGHSYGDELITRVASCLRGCLRETDVIGRLGGDEFAVVLASVSPEAAIVVAEKVLHAIADHGVVVSEARHASVTGSVGLVAFDGSGGLDAEALLVQADLAMYTAKQSGRNRVAVSRPDGSGEPPLAAERSWLHRLRAALDQDRFELFAQPISPICAAGSTHFELLLRMRDEGGELVAPATFLHNAERFDFIGEIDRWVFRRALEMLSERADEDVTVSVNMSGRTLGDPRLIDDLGAMIAAHPHARDRLIVEVTETAAIVKIERAREVARALRALGCRFALDDFGSGFASYYYLKHLEFDFLKIDGEFIKALGENPTDRLVVRSVVDLARGLGAQTIAEFVGDEPTIDVLRELGVDYGQGFHLGRPAPADEVLPPVDTPALRIG